MRHLRQRFSVERERERSLTIDHRYFSLDVRSSDLICICLRHRFCNTGGGDDGDEDDQIDAKLEACRMKADLSACVYDTTMSVIVPYVKVR